MSSPKNERSVEPLTEQKQKHAVNNREDLQVLLGFSSWVVFVLVAAIFFRQSSNVSILIILSRSAVKEVQHSHLIFVLSSTEQSDHLFGFILIGIRSAWLHLAKMCPDYLPEENLFMEFESGCSFFSNIWVLFKSHNTKTSTSIFIS